MHAALFARINVREGLWRASSDDGHYHLLTMLHNRCQSVLPVQQNAFGTER
jgi:hypothetical protein